MKVIEVISSLQAGGAENMVVQLLNGLSPERIEKHIVCFSRMDTPFSDMLAPEIHRHHIPLPRKGHAGCIAKMIKLFKRIQPHVVQSHIYHVNLLTAISAKTANVPVFISTEHGKNPWKKRRHRLLERFIISPLTTKRVAVSKDIRFIRVNNKECSADDITVIPPCVQIPEKPVQYIQKFPLKIGAVGRMVPAKDYLTLIHAFKIIHDAGMQAELYFIGDGPERSSLEKTVSIMGLGEVVFFPGLQAHVDEWLNTFDLVVFSSIREGTPVAMLEAMAHGVAMVATRVGGIPDVIRNEKEGLLVDAKNPRALANAMIRLIRDVDMRHRLGTQGRERVNALYSRKKISKYYENLFITLLKSPEQWKYRRSTRCSHNYT